MQYDFLQIGKKYTLVSIGDAMAMTVRQEITIYDYEEGNGRYLYKQKGKRGGFWLNRKVEDMLIFEGHDLPLRVDTDGHSVMRGNACYNFVSDNAEELRNFIDTKNVNTLFSNTDKGKILIIPVNGDAESEVLLYPEIETRHAVIDRLRQKA